MKQVLDLPAVQVNMRPEYLCRYRRLQRWDDNGGHEKELASKEWLEER